MRCKHCNARLAVHDLWCVNCGKQTQAVNEQLSAWASLKRTWGNFSPVKGMSVPAGGFAVLAGIIPVIAFIVCMRLFGFLDLAEVKTAGDLLLKLFVISIGLTVLTPISLIPFDAVCETRENVVTLKQVLAKLPSYSRYLVLTAFSSLFYAVIYLICFGLPNFGSDPILRLVWIVLVNYYAALVLPVPILMNRLNINALKAFQISYRHLHVVRWQIYLLALILGLLSLVAGVLVLIPLVIVLPFTWFAIRDYIDLLLSYELLRDTKPEKQS